MPRTTFVVTLVARPGVDRTKSFRALLKTALRREMFDEEVDVL